MTPQQLLSSAPREAWASHTGFVLASIGAAVGIGNIWRFPYMVGSNGGGAFLIPYVIAVALLGLPLMIVEFALGLRSRTSVVPAFEAIWTRFRPAALGLVAVLMMILAYYRKRAAAIAAAAVTLIGLPSALSYTALKVELFGTPLLDLKDFVFGTVGLMAAGLMMSVMAGWFAAPHLRHAAGVGRRG